MADTWRTFVGVVQYDPTPREVNGKQVVNIGIRPSGVKDQAINVSATLWPSHAAYFDKVEKGTVVVVEGKFDVRPNPNAGADKPKNFYNLSVSGIAVLGQLDLGERVESTSDEEGEGSEEDAW